MYVLRGDSRPIKTEILEEVSISKKDNVSSEEFLDVDQFFYGYDYYDDESQTSQEPIIDCQVFLVPQALINS